MKPWEAGALTRMPVRIHPVIHAVAQAIMREGWRVTSILRDSPTHRQGIALDCASFEAVRGGYGPRTAQLVWHVAKGVAPDSQFLVLAEPDHIHVNLNRKDIIGVQYPGYDHVWYDPISLQQLRKVS
jgi:hypothetical protein